jgi:hypothetical protein
MSVHFKDECQIYESQEPILSLIKRPQLSGTDFVQPIKGCCRRANDKASARESSGGESTKSTSVNVLVTDASIYSDQEFPPLRSEEEMGKLRCEPSNNPILATKTSSATHRGGLSRPPFPAIKNILHRP